MSQKVTKGSWVEIQNTILNPEERTANIPEETKKVPYIMKVRGFLEEDAAIGDVVTIKTMIGRQLTGKLIQENPIFPHNYGKPVPELLRTNYRLRKELQVINAQEKGE